MGNNHHETKIKGNYRFSKKEETKEPEGTNRKVKYIKNHFCQLCNFFLCSSWFSVNEEENNPEESEWVTLTALESLMYDSIGTINTYWFTEGLGILQKKVKAILFLLSVAN